MRYRAKTFRLGPLYATVTRSGRRSFGIKLGPTRRTTSIDTPGPGGLVHLHGRPKRPAPDFLPPEPDKWEDRRVNLRRLLPALALGALLAGCGGSDVSARALAPHALDGPDYSGYLAAVEGIPFFRGPHAAATAACERKARDMTREEAINLVARAMADVGFGRPEAQRTIDAVDQFNICPDSTAWES